MARKVFLSVLGTSNYGCCDYQKDGISYGNTRYIQIATLKYLKANEWCNTDIAYILLTNTAEKKNWVDNGHANSKINETINQTGLETEISKLSLPIKIETIKELPDGNNEKEIWTIFERVFTVINEGDELYFDITHGYRYLPMLIIVFANYAKFLKNAVIKSITYGNYEISERGSKPGLIIDLFPLSSLQDWTFAAGQYIQSGHTEQLVTLSKTSLRPMLQNAKGSDENLNELNKAIRVLPTFVDEITFCRASNVINGNTAQKLKDSLRSIKDYVLPQLRPILEQIFSTISKFDHNSVYNCLLAAEWCITNGYFQQATTILQEMMTTIVCQDNNINILDKSKRDLVNTTFNFISDGKSATELRNANDEDIALVETLMQNKYTQTYSKLFSQLKELRNDYNHAGMRESASSPYYMKSTIEKILNHLKSGLLLQPGTQQPTMLLNLSNHPSATWPEEQLQAAHQQYGDIKDMTFPDVKPEATQDDIEQLANDYLTKIQNIGSHEQVTVHIMGEMNFTFTLVSLLKANGYTCIASTTQRVVKEHGDNQKLSEFHFVQFRKY